MPSLPYFQAAVGSFRRAQNTGLSRLKDTGSRKDSFSRRSGLQSVVREALTDMTQFRKVQSGLFGIEERKGLVNNVADV